MHAPGMLSKDPQSECGCYSRHAHSPFVESEMVTPGTYHDTLPKVPQHAPMLSLPGYDLLKHTKSELSTNGMNKQGQLNSITEINQVFPFSTINYLAIYNTIYSL